MKTKREQLKSVRDKELKPKDKLNSAEKKLKEKKKEGEMSKKEKTEELTKREKKNSKWKS